MHHFLPFIHHKIFSLSRTFQQRRSSEEEQVVGGEMRGGGGMAEAARGGREVVVERHRGWKLGMFKRD